MKTAGSPLIALLATKGPFLFADLYTITLLGGAVLRFCSADVDITVGANTFSSSGPQIDRSRVRQTVGTEVQEMELDLAAKDADLLNGVPWLIAIKRGALDGATVLVERAVMSQWGVTTPGSYWVFGGSVSDITPIGRTVAKIMVKSDVEKLNAQFPQDIYQPQCRNTLFDANCTLNKESFGVNSAVTGGSTLTQINCGLAQAAGYFTLGTLSFTSGVNNGVRRTVKSYAPGVFTLSLPLVAPCTVGDTLRAYPGCDKLMGTCSGKFSNLLNFRGEPFIPVPETAL